jgi:hypothetical protein
LEVSPRTISPGVIVVVVVSLGLPEGARETVRDGETAAGVKVLGGAKDDGKDVGLADGRGEESTVVGSAVDAGSVGLGATSTPLLVAPVFLAVLSVDPPPRVTPSTTESITKISKIPEAITAGRRYHGFMDDSAVASEVMVATKRSNERIMKEERMTVHDFTLGFILGRMSQF